MRVITRDPQPPVPLSIDKDHGRPVSKSGLVEEPKAHGKYSPYRDAAPQSRLQVLPGEKISRALRLLKPSLHRKAVGPPCGVGKSGLL